MNALLSLPHASPKNLAYTLSVPAHLRARAGEQLRAAMRAGRIAPAELSEALEAGDAGLGNLMYRKHVLPGGLGLPPIKPSLHLTPVTAEHVMVWARHLRAAKRLNEASLLAVPKHKAFEGLVDACVRGSAPAAASSLDTLPPLACPSPRHTYFAVSTTFAENLYGATWTPNTIDENSRLSVFIEPTSLPLVDLPDTDNPEDATALLSAVEAIGHADSVGLWASPRHVPHILDGWHTEMICDAGRRAEKREDGSPIFTPALCAEIAEELGYELEDDSAETAALMEAHFSHLDALDKSQTWKPASASMKDWLRANEGRDLHALVKRLLAIADRLKKIAIRSDDVEQEHEGDAVTLMVAVPPSPELIYFQHAIENYGQGDTPNMRFTLSNAQQNPSAFWALHDSVVMAVSLVTDAANAIYAYENRQVPAR